MPTYAYRCSKCEHAFEEFHAITDTRRRKCPKCGARAARVPAGGGGLLFKGTGFYITDYRSKSYRERAKKESGGSSSPGGGGGTGSGEKGAGGGGSGKKPSGD